MKGDQEGWIGRVNCAGVLGVALLAALLFSGCANPIDSAVGDPLPNDASKRQASGELAPGDVISVSYPGAPEMNLTQKIRADGRISLPTIGDVNASGRSIPSFQSYLKGRYTDLQDPNVTVTVVSAAAAVYVSGAVNQPRKVPLDRPMTALEAVMEAGGLSPTAHAGKVSVVRTVGATHKRFNLNMTGALSGDAAVFYLQPYDVIYVGQRTW